MLEQERLRVEHEKLKSTDQDKSRKLHELTYGPVLVDCKTDKIQPRELTEITASCFQAYILI